MTSVLARLRRLTVVVGVCAVALGIGIAPTWAWWAASASTSVTLTAGTLQPPTGMSCTGAGLLATPTLSWTAPTSGLKPTQYVVTYRSGSATASPTTTTTTTTSWTMGSGLLNLLTTYYISVQSSLAGTNWVSTTDTTGYRVSVTGVVGISALTSCVGTYTPSS